MDNACQALSRVAGAFANKPALLEMLSTAGALEKALQLVQVSWLSQLATIVWSGLRPQTERAFAPPSLTFL